MDNRFYFGFNTSEERKKRRKAELYSMSEQVSTFFWDEAPQHGLEMREGQQDMSFEIVDALINDQHFAIEAGVGIGKSFGYAVNVPFYHPTLCWNRRTLSVQFRLQHLSARFSYSGWYAQGLPRSPWRLYGVVSPPAHGSLFPQRIPAAGSSGADCDIHLA